MTITAVIGFETGDASEISALGGGSSIVTSPVRSGAYALKMAGLSSVLLRTAISTTQFAVRFGLQIPAQPGVLTSVFQERVASTAARARIEINASNILTIVDTSAATLGTLTNITGTTVLQINQWYLIEWVMDLAAGGVLKVWLNGVLEINGSHATGVTGAPTANFAIQGAATPNEYFSDDIRIDSGTLVQIGDGRNIARQGKTGTPTNDAWTKTGLTTSALCWSETPFSATNNCNSATSAAAQTMLVSSFSATQAGHGPECITGGDTINACHVALIAKEATAGGGSIRRRLNGVNTDTAKAPATTDGYFDDGIWTDTVANLNTMEAGYVKSADANLTTVEDVWVIVDFTPNWHPEPFQWQPFLAQ